MGKSKKKSAKVLSWCWYCDREFEDDKVLLQHQKAKHFKCPHCPRRLNTAGGLAVHIDQVHKLGTDKISNALPGRDTFDVEIYGMEGIPAPDLAAWRRRVAERTGQTVNENKPQRPKVRKLPLSAQEAVAQLAQHKALMSGAPVSGTLAQLPFGLPPGVPPPPPGYVPPLPPGVVLPPHIQAKISGAAPVLPPPIPSFGATPPMPFFPPGASPATAPGVGGVTPLPFGTPLSGVVPAAQLGASTPVQNPLSAAAASQPLSAVTTTKQQQKEKMPSSAVEMKPGTTLVYGDQDVSPEEKRSRLSQYRLADIAAASTTTTPAPTTTTVTGGKEAPHGGDVEMADADADTATATKGAASPPATRRRTRASELI